VKITMTTLAALALGAATLPTTLSTPAQAADPASPAAAAIAALGQHAGAGRAAAGQGFQAASVHVDDDGSTHVRLDRTFGGLRVLGGDLVVHQGADGAWEGVSQTLAAPLHVPTSAAIGRAAARAAVLARNATTAAVAGDDEVSAAELVVDATGVTPRLAWEVVTGGVQADGTPSRLKTYVDARTGKVLRTEEGIHTADGSGASLYSGTVPLQLTPSGSSYLLKDPTRGGTYTTDLNNTTDSMFCQLFGSKCATGTTFTSTDTVFGNGTTGSRESAGVDAQYGTNMTWDYFKNVHGRNGIFGTGAGSYNRVHYGKNYVNAFWDGTKMTYGDGDGVSYGPLTSLDVAGHEMSHGVTENTAGLTYSGESGGLNEATSDIFGTMVEFYAANAADPGDYLIGEEFDLKSHLGLRRMDDPDSDGSSQNCWTTGTGGLDVHYSSGVGNHFFYLLSEGTGTKTFGGVAHTSTACNGATLTGIGRDAAAGIWFRALTVYMTSSTTYSGARTATLNAARDLYGAGSAQQNAVSAAWSAVNVS
jgi:Zn-dependent metalloprotease